VADGQPVSEIDERTKKTSSVVREVDFYRSVAYTNSLGLPIKDGARHRHVSGTRGPGRALGAHLARREKGKCSPAGCFGLSQNSGGSDFFWASSALAADHDHNHHFIRPSRKPAPVHGRREGQGVTSSGSAELPRVRSRPVLGLASSFWQGSNRLDSAHDGEGGPSL